MFKEISNMVKRPPVYTQAKVPFWDDPHISKQMLQAHLDPTFEGASRTLSFIEESVSWIQKTIPPTTYQTLLDVGCGPGIYAEGFCKLGYQVTGIDVSQRSIDYAQQSAHQQRLSITYHHQDYLTMEVSTTFDVATMIYCDYGALSIQNRQLLMSKIYEHLNPGGLFLLDVFSMQQYRDVHESQTWKHYPKGGFWLEEAYLELSGCYLYPENVTLEQTMILSETKTSVYYIWNTYFTKDSLMQEAINAGFKVQSVVGDVRGTPYHKESTTIAILLKKE